MGRTRAIRERRKAVQLNLFDNLCSVTPEPAPSERFPGPAEVAALIARRHRQLLVHSYLYYQLGESLIDDPTFDRWRLELVDLWRAHPDLAKNAPYADLCKTFVESPSGYSIRDYPPEIVSTAVRLLYQLRYKGTVRFEEFCARLGLRILP